MLKAGSGEHKKQPTISIPMSEFGLVAYVRLARPKRVDRRLAWALRAIFAPRKLQLLQSVLGLGFGSQHAIKTLNLALG